jgi:hypothetical protein
LSHHPTEAKSNGHRKQVISYRVPGFRVDGKTFAGFAAFKRHLNYLPFSGCVLPRLAEDLRGYTMTKSALHFPVDGATTSASVDLPALAPSAVRAGLNVPVKGSLPRRADAPGARAEAASRARVGSDCERAEGACRA